LLQVGTKSIQRSDWRYMFRTRPAIVIILFCMDFSKYCLLHHGVIHTKYDAIARLDGPTNYSSHAIVIAFHLSTCYLMPLHAHQQTSAIDAERIPNTQNEIHAFIDEGMTMVSSHIRLNGLCCGSFHLHRLGFDCPRLSERNLKESASTTVPDKIKRVQFGIR